MCGRGRLRAGVPSRIVSPVRRKRMKTVLVASSKGGVGKTTIPTHLAAQSALSGQHTVLVAADPQGSSPRWAERRAGRQTHVLPLDGTGQGRRRSVPDAAQRRSLNIGNGGWGGN